MARHIRLRFLEREIHMSPAKNVIAKSSIISAFLLPADATVSVTYRLNDLVFSCEMNVTGDLFLLPADGQDDYFVDSNRVFWRPGSSLKEQYTIPSRPQRPISPYHPELSRDPAPLPKCFDEWMFFLNEPSKSTTICVHPRFFVTFRHGSHRRFNIGDNLKIYHAKEEVNEQTGVEVRVVRIVEAFDFILLKSDSDVVDRKPRIAFAKESEPFTLAGFGSDTGSLTYLPGSIHSVYRQYFNGVGPFIMGTCQRSCGDSGGGVWGAQGLIGMNYGYTTMPLKNHFDAISEAAIFSPKNIISPVYEFVKAYMEELEKERKETNSPPNKKSNLVTVVDGRTIYGTVL